MWEVESAQKQWVLCITATLQGYRIAKYRQKPIADLNGQPQPQLIRLRILAFRRNTPRNLCRSHLITRLIE
jgi:hypothetical protein